MQNPIQKLIEEFSKFPGVGPRQARRFAYYLLTRDDSRLSTLTELLANAKKSVLSCTSCGRLFSREGKTVFCLICADQTREKTQLMIVAHDVDIDSIEKSGSYRGYYVMLGGTIPILEEKPEQRIRLGAVRKTVTERIKNGLAEIILALDLNPEGEHTMGYLMGFLKPLVCETVCISKLGRGLSTGTELQYSDPDTIKNALINRAPTKL